MDITYTIVDSSTINDHLVIIETPPIATPPPPPLPRWAHLIIEDATPYIEDITPSHHHSTSISLVG